MDDFVRNKLTEWGLSEWIPNFEDEGIDEESLFCIGDADISKLIPRMGPRLKFEKRLKCLKVLPSTSDTRDKDEIILSDVKNIMRSVQTGLTNQDDKFNKFLKDKITDLETDKRELVGVFGKTGAGKSSLINAIIGEKDLLPSGEITACTSVMIKVEANMQSPKYEAEIEFITKEEWKDELWSLLNFLGDITDQGNDQEDDSDYHDIVEKLSALYGEEWRQKSPDDLMDKKYFREVPEFLIWKKKILAGDSAKELSAKCVKYTRSGSKDGEGAVKRWFWPLVKCVTVRVPNRDLLQHVTLVDLPGNGDRNKSRDKMWKEIVGSCSTVWVVTEMNRAVSEKEAWEILESASSLMGNGGQCQQIHFICTKSDRIEDPDDLSAAGVRAHIFKRNMRAKEEVKKEFSKLNKVKKHFSDDCFKVFTVSSKEFQKKKHLEPEETEIPQLQDFLQNLNDCHSETLNYVSGAHGILSLIQGAGQVTGKKTEVCADLEKNLTDGLKKIRQPMEEAYKAFEKCLSEGVENSTTSCLRAVRSILYPTKMKRGFHQTLKRIVENGGVHKTQKKKQINLNLKLASCLTDSIDEEFKKTFPNERNCEPFNGVINEFSLVTKSLIEKYKEVELQLIFLETEENKIKTKLNKLIRERKKTIYSSLMTTVEEAMKKCYRKAAEYKGDGSLQKMRDTIEQHVRDSTNMFEQAKDEMLRQLRNLEEEILKNLMETLQKSIELSLETDDSSIQDFSVELEMVKKHCNELKERDEETSAICTDQPGPSSSTETMKFE